TGDPILMGVGVPRGEGHARGTDDTSEARTLACACEGRARSLIAEGLEEHEGRRTGDACDAFGESAATQYFELNETDGTDRVRYAAYYLDGEANVWWQWLTRIYHKRQQIITWDVYERELLTRFGTSDYHNYNEALTRIRQTGSLREYIREFERLACRVRDWPEDALVGAFIGGLKFDMAAEVWLERPDTMHDAMEVARRREDHLVATRRGRADTRNPDTRRTGPSQLPASTRPAFNTRPAGSLVRRLSPEE
ncbi:Unknown protein, partial [Striga hermonthica]